MRLFIILYSITVYCVYYIYPILPQNQKSCFLIDSKLKFDLHTLSISQSINYTLHNSRVIRPYINLKTAPLLATSLLLSRLDYCNSAFHLAPFSLIKTLQKLQNDAMRLFNLPNYSRQRIYQLRKNSTGSPLLHE